VSVAERFGRHQRQDKPFEIADGLPARLMVGSSELRDAVVAGTIGVLGGRMRARSRPIAAPRLGSMRWSSALQLDDARVACAGVPTRAGLRHGAQAAHG
jgi:hypothetical protein